MSAQYHINQKTGNPNICKAKPGNCPLKGDDNQQAEHYETKAEAQVAYEKQMEAKAKADAERQKAEKERVRQERMTAAKNNWPIPSSDKVAEYTAKGYGAEPQSRALYADDSPISSSTSADISVMAGRTYAIYGDNDNPMDQSMRYRNEIGREAKIEFTDYGTRLTEDGARDHLKKLEATLNDSNKFVNRINETVSDAEALYGMPKKIKTDFNHYEKVEQVDDTLNSDVKILDVKEDKYPLGGRRSFTAYGNSFNLYVSKDSSGEVSTQVNMSSMQRSTDVNDFKDRIYELRNILATADDLKKRL